jgi:hypothetical protein
MRIIEQPPDRLRLIIYDPSPDFITRGCWAIIAVVFVIGIYIADKMQSPSWVPWIVAICFLLLAILGLSYTDFTPQEYLFDRESNELKITKRSSVGKSVVEHYPLRTLAKIKVVKVTSHTHSHWTGPDYGSDHDDRDPIEDPVTRYYIELITRSERKFSHRSGENENDATQLARKMADFLGLPLITE